jgi:hypothetical protein
MDEAAERLARLPLAGVAAEEFAHNLKDRRFADILAVKSVEALAVEGAGEGRDCTCRARPGESAGGGLERHRAHQPLFNRGA